MTLARDGKVCVWNENKCTQTNDFADDLLRHKIGDVNLIPKSIAILDKDTVMIGFTSGVLIRSTLNDSISVI